jgi:hypothetical protein
MARELHDPAMDRNICTTQAAVVVAVLLSGMAPGAHAATRDVTTICAGEAIVFEEPEFAAFDRNADAMLDERETRDCESLSTLFDELDVDGDESLTELEYLTFPAMWQQRKLAFDEDDD